MRSITMDSTNNDVMPYPTNMITAAHLEEWIVRSADPSDPMRQRQATACLQDWSNAFLSVSSCNNDNNSNNDDNDMIMINLLLQLIVPSPHHHSPSEIVVFYALSTLERYFDRLLIHAFSSKLTTTTTTTTTATTEEKAQQQKLHQQLQQTTTTTSSTYSLLPHVTKPWTADLARARPAHARVRSVLLHGWLLSQQPNPSNHAPASSSSPPASSSSSPFAAVWTAPYLVQKLALLLAQGVRIEQYAGEQSTPSNHSVGHHHQPYHSSPWAWTTWCTDLERLATWQPLIFCHTLACILEQAPFVSPRSSHCHDCCRSSFVSSHQQQQELRTEQDTNKGPSGKESDENGDYDTTPLRRLLARLCELAEQALVWLPSTTSGYNNNNNNNNIWFPTTTTTTPRARINEKYSNNDTTLSCLSGGVAVSALQTITIYLSAHATASNHHHHYRRYFNAEKDEDELVGDDDDDDDDEPAIAENHSWTSRMKNHTGAQDAQIDDDEENDEILARILRLLFAALDLSTTTTTTTTTTMVPQSQRDAVVLTALEAFQEYILTTALEDGSSASPNHDSSSTGSVVVVPALIQRLNHLLPPNHAFGTESGGDGRISILTPTVDHVELDVLIQAAKVANALGLSLLIPSLENAEADSNQTSEIHHERQGQATAITTITTLQQSILELFFRAFSYDDMDVSAAVLPLAGRLVPALATQPQSPESTMNGMHRSYFIRQQQPVILSRLLQTLYYQLKHDNNNEDDDDDDDDFVDPEDESDAEEEVYRADLCKLYNKLVRANPQTCLEFLQAAVQHFLRYLSSNTTPSATAAILSDVEATLRLLYHYCEGIRPPPGLKVVMKNPAFCSLLVALHQSNLCFLLGPQQPKYRRGPHVLCLYYDVAVRYSPLFQNPQYTPLLERVLQVMTGPSGLLHEHVRVRYRSCYLLLRLVKSVATMLRPYVETAVTGIQQLLVNSSTSQSSLGLPQDTQLYLFETMGILLGKTGVETTQQQVWLTQLMTPHVESIDQILANKNNTEVLMMLTQNRDCDEVLAGSIAAITALSKGFQKPSEGVQAVMLETVNVALRVLEALPASEQVRNKCMVFVQRMIVCVGAKILPKIPPFLYLLIIHCTAEDILFVSQIFNQLCIKFKTEAVPIIDAALIPFLQKCHTLVVVAGDQQTGMAAMASLPASSPSLTAPHVETEQMSIQKLSYAVLQHVVTHQATSVLLSPNNINSLENILNAMSDGAQVNDPVIKRTCIRFFRELFDQWTKVSPGSINSHDVVENEQHELLQARHALTQFCCRVFVPRVWQSMMDNSTFDERDAMQARTVTELAHVLALIRGRAETSYQDCLNAMSGLQIVQLDALSFAASAPEVESCLNHILAEWKNHKNKS